MREILLSVDGPLHNIVKTRPPMVFSKDKAARFLAVLTLKKTSEIFMISEVYVFYPSLTSPSMMSSSGLPAGGGGGAPAPPILPISGAPSPC